VNPNFVELGQRGYAKGDTRRQPDVNNGIADAHAYQRRGGPQSVQQGPFASSQGPLDRTAAGHKRKLDALWAPEESRAKLPGPDIAPAVPSFGAFTLPPKPSMQTTQPKPHQQPVHGNKPKAKSLGLTPQANGHEEDDIDSPSEDEDVDEEAQYAELGTKLTFEHDGQVLSLSNAADLAAWREERRRRWPTNTRVDQKELERRLVGQERRRLLDGARALHKAPQRKHDMKSAQSQQSNVQPNVRDRIPRPHEDEPLGRSVNASHKFAAPDVSAEDEMEASAVEVDKQNVRALDMDNAPLEGRKPLPGIDMAETDDEVASDAEAASSSSSESEPSSDADSDEDSAPDEATSKPPTSAVSGREQPVCRYFAASGYCRDGTACRFRHELSRKGEVAIARAQQHRTPKAPYDRFAPKLDPSTALERKNIHDRLVEQERIEEDRLALKAIKFLGQAGFFNATPSVNEERV